MTLFRAGWRVFETYPRRASICPLERVFACFPNAIVITTDSAETVAPGDTRSLYQQLVGLHLEETATGS